MSETLSGVGIIICMALGLLMFIQLFIFVKRQIVRFALKFRFPNLSVLAPDAPKSLRDEIERRLEVVRQIRHEPKLLYDQADVTFNHENSIHIWRMRAVDLLPRLDGTIALSMGTSPEFERRRAYQDLGEYLHSLACGGFLKVKSDEIEEFAALYLHARKGIKPFGQEEYLRFALMVDRFCDSVVFDSNRVNNLKNKNDLNDLDKKPPPPPSELIINGRSVTTENAAKPTKSAKGRKFAAWLKNDGRLGTGMLLLDDNNEANSKGNKSSDPLGTDKDKSQETRV